MTPEQAMKLRVKKGLKPTNLQQVRVKKGLSQSELADKAGVSARWIMCCEQREMDIDKARFKQLCKICNALECKIEDILESEELICFYKKIK